MANVTDPSNPRLVAAHLDAGLRDELTHWDYPGGRNVGHRPSRRITLRGLGLRDDDGELTPLGREVIDLLPRVHYGEGVIVPDRPRDYEQGRADEQASILEGIEGAIEAARENEHPAAVEALCELVDHLGLERPRSAWRPMAEAPRDGTYVLMSIGEGAPPLVVSWRTYHPNAKGKPAWRTYQGTKHSDGTGFVALPKAPS